MSDWKAIVKSVAPTLGGLLTTFGGPAGALAGAGLGAVAAALGVATGDAAADEAAVSAAVMKGLSTEQQAALIAADTDYRKALVVADVRKTEVSADTERAYILDVDAARRAHAQTQGVMILGYLINVSSYVCVGGVLWGCFWLLGGRGLNVDPGIAAMVGGIIGAAVQWLLSNAAQANGFFFGSSPSSRSAAINAQLGQSVARSVETVNVTQQVRR